jgi:ribonuclease VapC
LIVLDTSVLVAILRREPEAISFEEMILQAGGGLLSAVSYLELCMVIAGKNHESVLDRVDSILRRMNISTVDTTVADATFAREAFLRFGKGRHVAALNLGDCFSYALAKRLGEPLLFKGDDFTKTDLRRA